MLRKPRGLIDPFNSACSGFADFLQAGTFLILLCEMEEVFLEFLWLQSHGEPKGNGAVWKMLYVGRNDNLWI